MVLQVTDSMGDWNRDSAVISVNEGLGPEIGGWSTTISFSTTRYHHTSVVHNGYLYVIGGYGGNSLNDVQYAPINSDGTLGTWNTTTPFTGGRGSHASVVHNGYLYVIGGYENMTDNHLNDVQYAPINADGTVGGWSTTTSFTNVRQGHTSVVHNGHLYVIGGHDQSSGSSVFLNDVQYAPISADGTVGSWSTTISFATARHAHTSVVYNEYLYLIGGYDESSRFNDVQYAPFVP